MRTMLPAKSFVLRMEKPPVSAARACAAATSRLTSARATVARVVDAPLGDDDHRLAVAVVLERLEGPLEKSERHVDAVPELEVGLQRPLRDGWVDHAGLGAVQI